MRVKRYRNTEQTFWERVSRGDPDGCWPWLGWKDGEGYGTFWIDGRYHRAHRFAYELLVGPIPEGLQPDHLCRNHACCNPTHLEPVTQRENILRGFSPTAINARKTHCAKGHPYDDKNTRIDKHGWRSCRICKAGNLRRLRRRRREDKEMTK
jgi:hypothetical protein